MALNNDGSGAYDDYYEYNSESYGVESHSTHI
jgi:hypothetical protein